MMRYLNFPFTAVLVLTLGVVFSLVVGSFANLSAAQPVQATGNVGVGSSAATADPVVVIINPINGSQVSGTVSIDAEASSSAGVKMVDFRVDGTPTASDSAYPYSVSWDTTTLVAGSWHLIEAIVYDYADATASAIINVQIAPTPTPTPSPSPTPTPTPEPTPVPVPTVSITNPLDGGIVKRGTVVTIAAEASDSQGISKVEFYVGNTLTCTDSTSSYTCNWKVPTRYKTSYTLTAKAYNLAGNTTSSSIKVNSR